MESNKISYHLDKTLSEKLINLSKTTADTSCGFLYGSQSDSRVNVTAACHIPEELKTGTFTNKFLKNRCMFPVGVDPIGMFLCGCHIKECPNIIPMSMNSRLPEEFVCAHIDKGTEVVLLYLYNRLTKALESLEYTELAAPPYINHVMLRVSTTVQIVYKFSTKKSELHDNCTSAVEAVCRSVHSSNVYYRLQESDVIVSSDKVIGAGSEDSLGETLKMIEKRRNESDGSVRPKRSAATEDQPKIVYVEMLTKLTNEITGAAIPSDHFSFSPVIQYEKADELVVTVDLPISSVVLAEKSETLDNLSELFYRSIVRQLHGAQHILADYTGTEIPTLAVSHYWPAGMNFPLSLIQSTSSQDSDLVEWRKDIHTKLLLAGDRPYFRKANAYYFPCDISPSALLINPHDGLSMTRQLQVGDGAVHLVYGKYAYHHYMQDRFDDDKWGCAYRSLQTLVSWFRLQGYSTANVPSHRDIQQTLVDIGDKESSFVGSRQWIGSTEVSFVLEKLLGVTSKILVVSSGADLANKGRELVQHFQTQGTPIMIGGGVLAHTILGVYYNDQTGDIKFLILDPHLTRLDEDLKYIQDKGWCGWKNADFWDASAFYNMCMPQRPLEF